MISFRSRKFLLLKVTKAFLKHEAAILAKEIMKRRHSQDDYTGGAYVGVAGDGYSVLYAARLLPEKRGQYTDFCCKMVEAQLKKIEVFRVFINQEVRGFWLYLPYVLW